MSEVAELAFRTALNVLGDSIETGRMRSCLILAAEALATHTATIAECDGRAFHGRDLLDKSCC